MTVLRASDAYHAWAPHYAAETAVSRLEAHTVDALDLPAECDWLLDVGCGLARRLQDTTATNAVGIDLVPRMLQHATVKVPCAAADVRALPFSNASFDVVWCRLVIGHLAQLETAYAELARVCRRGGTVLVTDFHSAAVAAGHRRTFTDDAGSTHEIEHFVHTPDAHVAAARRAGLVLTAQENAVVSPPIRSFYADAGRLHRYEEQLGLPLVLACVYRVP